MASGSRAFINDGRYMIESEPSDVIGVGVNGSEFEIKLQGMCVVNGLLVPAFYSNSLQKNLVNPILLINKEGDRFVIEINNDSSGHLSSYI